jgi:hypothetical protein
MDGFHFDTLTRTLTVAASRRQTLGSLLGGALGLLGSRAEEAAAKKKCPPCKKRKQGKCKGKKPDGTACSGGSCQSGRCVPTLSCSSGYTPCGQQCVDLRDNTQHCGACFTVCSPGKVCCSGTCANLLDDDNHCAACGRRCLTRDEETPRLNAAEICSNGTCVDCSIAGNIREGGPTTCCRGLRFCPGNATGSVPARCIPANQTC